MVSVWRLRMKSDAGNVDHAAARDFAIENGIVGAGWHLDAPGGGSLLPDMSNDVEEYLRHATSVFGSRSSLLGAVESIGRRMKIGDFGWMYATHKGEYWCCRIDGEFQYRAGGDFDLYDLHIVRPCTWALAGTADAVPGVIRRAFAGPFGVVGTITTGANRAIEAVEIALGTKAVTTRGDLFDTASPEDLEDLVSLYLQSLGWMIFPTTSKASMASYEFVLVNQSNGERAGVQVKSGNVWRLDQAVAGDFDKFFIFLANPSAHLTGSDPRIQILNRKDLLDFAQANWKLLPKRLQLRWPKVP